MVATLFSGTLPSLAELPEPLREGLIFHAGFDHSPDADFAIGNPMPERMNGIYEAGEGVRGGALKMGDGHMESLYYAIEGNFEAAAGTVAFWILPVDWLGEAGTRLRTALFQVGRSGTGYHGLQIGRFGTSRQQLMYFSLDYPDRGRESIVSQEEWENGVWRHVALTWDAYEARLYLDGIEVGRESFSAPYTNEMIRRETFLIGSVGGERLRLDEFRIWKRPLSEAEIYELYNLEKPQ